MSDRNVRRLTLAAVLVAVVGITRGLDTAMTVVLCLVVMEVDGQTA